MHEQRIAALEDALVLLASPAVLARFSPAAIATRWAALEAELALLRGIRDRNRALDAERPRIAAETDRLAEHRRALHEAIQRHYRTISPDEQAQIDAAAASLKYVLALEAENLARVEATVERRRQIRENRQIAVGRRAARGA